MVEGGRAFAPKAELSAARAELREQLLGEGRGGLEEVSVQLVPPALGVVHRGEQACDDGGIA